MDFHIFTTFTIVITGFVFSISSQRDTFSIEKALRIRNALRIKKAYLYFLWVLLVFESGSRGLSVGDDTLGYSVAFENIKKVSWIEIFQGFNKSGQGYDFRDPAYNLFQKIFQVFSSDFRVYLYFIAILFFTSLIYFLHKNTYKLYELILASTIYCALFYPFFSITGIRQTITTSVALYCTKYIKEKKILKFTIPIVLVSYIHSSVLVFLPFYYLSNFKNVRRNLALALTAFPVIMLFRNNLAVLFATGTVYENYLTDLSGKGTFTFTSLIIIIIAGSYFFIDQMHRVYRYYNVYYNAMIMALVFVPLTWVNSNAMRVVQYFSIYMMVFIPKIIEVATSYSIKLKRVTYLFCILVLFYLIFKTSKPYVFFWNETTKLEFKQILIQN